MGSCSNLAGMEAICGVSKSSCSPAYSIAGVKPAIECARTVPCLAASQSMHLDSLNTTLGVAHLDAQHLRLLQHDVLESRIAAHSRGGHIEIG